MPGKNAIKRYETDSYYHLYNRGVAKRTIFKTDKDYKTFLSYLQLYLTHPSPQGSSSKIPPSRSLKNYADEIKLLSYCLMPNHFHLLVHQNSSQGINHFMRSLCTKYVRYFNSHYQRVGHLFQGTYRAVQITSENQFTHLSKYIHRNPLDLPAPSTYKETPRRLEDYPYSSYPNYLGKFHQTWVHPNDILNYFSKSNPGLSYRSFVEESDSNDAFLAPLSLDSTDLRGDSL